MLDPFIRPYIDLPLNAIGRKLALLGISANQITLLGFFFGLFSMGLIIAGANAAAAIFLILNRFSDGIDGAVARHTKQSDFGGFLDIVCDFIVYSGIVLACGLRDPSNMAYAAFLIFSFIGPMSSFLAYATIAAKKNMQCEKRGKKSFYYAAGLCEGTETAVFLLLMCVFPQYLKILALTFAGLCWLTTMGRSYRAFLDFE